MSHDEPLLEWNEATIEALVQLFTTRLHDLETASREAWRQTIPKTPDPAPPANPIGTADIQWEPTNSGGRLSWETQELVNKSLSNVTAKTLVHDHAALEPRRLRQYLDVLDKAVAWCKDQRTLRLEAARQILEDQSEDVRILQRRLVTQQLKEERIVMNKNGVKKKVKLAGTTGRPIPRKLLPPTNTNFR